MCNKSKYTLIIQNSSINSWIENCLETKKNKFLYKIRAKFKTIYFVFKEKISDNTSLIIFAFNQLNQL